MEYKHAHKRASCQRLIALSNSFNTLEAFIIPSASPDILEKYEEVKKYLMDNYSKDINEEDLKDYKF
jgi:hypothetical protein